MEKWTWTQEEAINYECAREAITHLSAILTSEMVEESKKPCPDLKRLASLEAEHMRLFHERNKLGVKDHAEIARVRSEYGAMIRAWQVNQTLPL